MSSYRWNTRDGHRNRSRLVWRAKDRRWVRGPLVCSPLQTLLSLSLSLSLISVISPCISVALPVSLSLCALQGMIYTLYFRSSETYEETWMFLMHRLCFLLLHLSLSTILRHGYGVNKTVLGEITHKHTHTHIPTQSISLLSPHLHPLYLTLFALLSLSLSLSLACRWVYW